LASVGGTGTGFDPDRKKLASFCGPLSPFGSTARFSTRAFIFHTQSFVDNGVRLLLAGF
jgi:hypothetical protein